MKKCYCCGAEVPDDARFCVKCGKPMEITQDLIDRARAGDSDAQTELYERTYKTVYSRTRAKVPDEDMVMDIMQETYFRAFTNLDQLKKAETFPSWLLTIASRQASNWFRKNGKDQENIQLSQLEYENDDRLSDEDDPLEMPETQIDLIPDQALDRAETGRLLSEILDTLPEDQRMILTMRYYDDMSLKEISEELGVNLSTVKSRLTAGQKKVKAKVLELEKSGTKLYSLGPVAFLVYLLRHAELFAPDIPSNTILGLTGTGAAAGGASAASVAGSTAAGGASTGAGGAVSGGVSAGGAASNIAGGTAAKASVAAAAKGISVRAAVAIVAAAVVVAGGGITTAVVVNNSSSNPEPVSVSTITIEPSETDETTVIEPPSTETVMTIANYFAYTGDSSTIKSSDDNDWIEVTFEDACDAAAAAVVKNNEDTTDYSSRSTQYPSGVDPNDQTIYAPISEEAVSRCLRNLFGSQYQLSDYTRDKTHSNDNGYSSSYQLIRSDDGTYWVTAPNADDGLMYTTPEVLNITSDTENNEAYIATIRYSYYYGEPESIYRGYRDITFRLKYDEGSDYNWVITAFKYGSFIPLEDEETGKSIKTMYETMINEYGETTSYDYSYDRDGNVMSYILYIIGGDSYLDNYTYDTYNGSENKLLKTKEHCSSDATKDTYSLLYRHTFDYTFYEDGNIKTCEEYNEDGSICSETEYTYDNSGNVLTEIYNDGDNPSSKHVYTYDEKGNVLTDYYYWGTNLSQWREYTYDSDGNMLTFASYPGDGHERYEYYVYKYDEKGNMVTATSYTPDDTIYEVTDYAYNDNGDVSSTTTVDSNGIETSSTSYEYGYYD